MHPRVVTEVRWRSLKIVILLIEIALLVYVTLDAIYIHTWFNAENAVLVPIVQIVIVIVSGSCFQWIKQRRSAH
jgi:hypothetical protein